MAGNNALGTNSVVGPQANLAVTRHGSDWYYAVCAVMGLSTLIFMGLAMRKPQTHRIFHYITATITAVACIAYFCMGSGLGQTPIEAEFHRRGIVRAAGTREIFYVRYIDWFITTPLLLVDLLLTAGIPWPTLLVTILADWIMIVCGLVGALVSTRYKWAFWTFGMFALFFVAYELLIDARRHATAFGGPVRSTFMRCGVLTIFLWFLYPIAWGVSEGGNVIHPDSEAIFYGILDIFAKVGFGVLLIFGHNNIDPATIGLSIRQPGTYANQNEKNAGGAGATTGNYAAPSAPLPGSHNGTHNGTDNGTTTTATA